MLTAGLERCVLRSRRSTRLGGTSNTITFDLTSGELTIALQSALPEITAQVDIQGNSVPSFLGSPFLVLDGSSAGSQVSGLMFGPGSSGSTVQSLIIDDFGSGYGIDVETSNII
jgi:hypothetical protein